MWFPSFFFFIIFFARFDFEIYRKKAVTFCASTMSLISSSSGESPAYQQQRGYPSGSAHNDCIAADLLGSFSSSTSSTSGVASGEGSEASTSGSHQRLFVGGVGSSGTSTSNEQGVQDLRSIIQ